MIILAQPSHIAFICVKGGPESSIRRALSARNRPFTVTNGKIGKIRLTVPDTSLRSKPCELEIDEVFIFAEILGNVLQNAESGCAVQQHS
jgi:hypothetical protein